MLGLILIYFIGKNFHELATTHQKTGWLFAVAGVISYYVGTFIAGVLMVMISGFEFADNMDDLLLGLIALPFGILSCFLFYKFLENSWSKTPVSTETDVLDDDFVQNID